MFIYIVNIFSANNVHIYIHKMCTSCQMKHLVGVGEKLWVGGQGSNPLSSISLDFPLPFQNSNSCNPTLTIHYIEKGYLSIGVVDGL